MLNVAIIGFGNAGKRFFNAIEIVNSGGDLLKVLSIADLDLKVFSALNSEKISCYQNYEKMLLENEFDLIFIATNDNYHFDILKFIFDFKIKYNKIICEKPLVNNPYEISYLKENFCSDSIIVHFVERYSDVVSELRDYINNNSRKVRRIYFDWSKFRLNDPRPTVGVVSEITHPLDLVLYISNISCGANFDNFNTWINQSDFHTGGISRPDSITLGLDFENGPIVFGYSSYLRSERTRKMEFILTDKDGNATELAVIEFDKPLWDYDYLKIYDITESNGNLIKIHDKSINPIENSQHGLAKICKFIELVVENIESPNGNALANMEQGLFVQEIVLSLLDNSKESSQRLFNKLHERPLSFDANQVNALINNDGRN